MVAEWLRREEVNCGQYFQTSTRLREEAIHWRLTLNCKNSEKCFSVIISSQVTGKILCNLWVGLSAQRNKRSTGRCNEMFLPLVLRN